MDRRRNFENRGRHCGEPQRGRDSRNSEVYPCDAPSQLKTREASRLECKSLDISEIQRVLDSGAKDQEAIVIRAIAALRALPQGKTQARFISQTLQRAHKLQIRNWVLAYSLPQLSTTCSNASILCVTSSNTDILGEYRTHNVALRDLAIAVLDRVKRARKGKLSARDTALYSAAERQFNTNLETSNTVPEIQYTCATKK